MGLKRVWTHFHVDLQDDDLHERDARSKRSHRLLIDSLEEVSMHLFDERRYAGPAMGFGLSQQKSHLQKIPSEPTSGDDLEFLRLSSAILEELNITSEHTNLGTWLQWPSRIQTLSHRFRTYCTAWQGSVATHESVSF
jgi:hypothetical protein